MRDSSDDAAIDALKLGNVTPETINGLPPDVTEAEIAAVLEAFEAADKEPDFSQEEVEREIATLIASYKV